MGEFFVSPEAERDLDYIFDVGLDLFGLHQAIRFQDRLHDQFQLLADFPGLGGQPLSGLSREVYCSPFVSHLILYEKSETRIIIVRIIHGSIEDVRKLLR